jgi:hypothetical protein
MCAGIIIIIILLFKKIRSSTQGNEAVLIMLHICAVNITKNSSALDKGHQLQVNREQRPQDLFFATRQRLLKNLVI